MLGFLGIRNLFRLQREKGTQVMTPRIPLPYRISPTMTSPI
jgi:hypothetical protein